MTRTVARSILEWTCCCLRSESEITGAQVFNRRLADTLDAHLEIAARPGGPARCNRPCVGTFSVTANRDAVLDGTGYRTSFHKDDLHGRSGISRIRPGDRMGSTPLPGLAAIR